LKTFLARQMHVELLHHEINLPVEKIAHFMIHCFGSKIELITESAYGAKCLIK